MRSMIARLPLFPSLFSGTPAHGKPVKTRAARAALAKSALPRRPRRRLSLHGRGAIAGALLLAAILTLTGLFLYRSGRLEAFAARMTDSAVVLAAQCGVAVQDIEVEGRKMTSREAILHAIGAQRGTPLLAIDPQKAKAELERLPWIRSAAVERRLPDTISIRISERSPLAFWQRQGKLTLIDRDGAAITDERLDRFPGLIVMVGEDAPANAGGLLDMLKTQPELAARVVAAVRVGGRRWNLHLDNGVDVQLPEENPAAAWDRLAALEHESRLLARNIDSVDMRLPDRLVLHPIPDPAKDLPKKGRPAAKST